MFAVSVQAQATSGSGYLNIGVMPEGRNTYCWYDYNAGAYCAINHVVAFFAAAGQKISVQYDISPVTASAVTLVYNPQLIIELIR